MAVIQAKNTSGGPVSPQTVVKGTTTVVSLGSFASGASVNSAIVWPRGSVGRIRFRSGVGFTPMFMSMQASELVNGFFTRRTTVPLKAGDKLWPATKVSLATNMASISSGGVVLTDTLVVDLLDTTALIGTTGTPDILGVTDPSSGVVEDGGWLKIITGGPAFVTCSGGWMKADKLCAGPSGTMRKAIAGKDLTQAVAEENQKDGDTDCLVTVTLA